MAGMTASDRIRRMLAIVPWLVEQGGASVDEICQRFSITEKALLADLDVLAYTGVYPYTPDAMNEVSIVGDWVRVEVAPHFRKPLKLTHDEALAVVVSARALAEMPGVDPDGPLQRALVKLQGSLGDAASGVGIDLGTADGSILSTLRNAIRSRERLVITYYSAGSDRISERAIDPQRLVTRDGNWYLVAWCHSAADERLFRVDRISAVDRTDETFENRGLLGEATFLSDIADLPRVTLQLAPPARIWMERVPVVHASESDDGQLTVTLAVSGRAWLATLLMRLGGDATIVSVASGAGSDLTVADLEADRAELVARTLSRYRDAT